MDFRRIEYFLKVAEKLNYSEASKELFISPQALSQQIAKFESELGVTLFLRNTRRVLLTEEGQYCYEQLAPAKAQFDKAVIELKGRLSATAKPIKVSFFNGIPKMEILNPCIDLIRTKLGADGFELLSGDLNSIRNGLDNKSADIYITNVDSFFPLERFKAAVLLISPAKIVVSPHHPWAKTKDVGTEDIQSGKMLQLRGPDDRLERNFYSQVRCGKVKIVDSFDTMLANLESGECFAVFPPSYEFQHRASFVYVNLPVEYQFNFMTICACRNDHERSDVKKTVEYVSKKFLISDM